MTTHETGQTSQTSGASAAAPRRGALRAVFDAAARERRAVLVAYLTFGDPDPAASLEVLAACAEAGAGVIELGVPFSDPLADGLVNQLAAQRGLESGATPKKVLETVMAVRKHSQVPIVLYIYFNLIHKQGVKRFIDEAARAGVDGLLVLDLPPEESENYASLMAAAGLCHIFLVAPTTPEELI